MQDKLTVEERALQCDKDGECPRKPLMPTANAQANIEGAEVDNLSDEEDFPSAEEDDEHDTDASDFKGSEDEDNDAYVASDDEDLD